MGNYTLLFQVLAQKKVRGGDAKAQQKQDTMLRKQLVAELSAMANLKHRWKQFTF
jgi:hypothetical protein